MNVLIAHAPQDKTAAESLAEQLRKHAFLVALETGEGAMQPLSPRDAVVGLISKDFAFSPHKLRLEKRLLDAWADGQLVQVKLDHAFAPVGLRDLPAIDASFEAPRDPFTWIKVADALRALQTPPQPAPAPQSPAPETGDFAPSKSAAGRIGRASSPRSSINYDLGGDHADSPPPPDAPPPGASMKRAASKTGAGLWALLLILMAAGAGAAALFFLKGEAPQSNAPAPGHTDQPANPMPPPDYTPPVDVAGIHFSQPILMATAIVVGLLIMTAIAIKAANKAKPERRMGKPAKGKKAKREAPTNAPSYSVAPPLTEQAAEPLVFISYARADQPSVDPLAKAVKASGHPIWIDTDEINAGTSWAGEIVRAIKSAGHVLIMCSPRSFESDQVKREVYLADRYKKPLMPVFLEAAEPPEDFEYFFAGVQWLKLHEAPEADRAAILTRALPAA